MSDKLNAESGAGLAAAAGSALLRAPEAAATYLAESMRQTELMRSEIEELLDTADDDNVWERVHAAKEKLREMDHHATGTSIGLAMDFGAWHRKDGWQPASTHPLLDGVLDGQSACLSHGEGEKRP
jgi:hypothetical protein